MKLWSFVVLIPEVNRQPFSCKIYASGHPLSVVLDHLQSWRLFLLQGQGCCFRWSRLRLGMVRISIDVEIRIVVIKRSFFKRLGFLRFLGVLPLLRIRSCLLWNHHRFRILIIILGVIYSEISSTVC